MKRYPRWAIIVALPPALVWTVFAELGAGIKSGCKNARWLIREQIDIAKAHWRGEAR